MRLRCRHNRGIAIRFICVKGRRRDETSLSTNSAIDKVLATLSAIGLLAVPLPLLPTKRLAFPNYAPPEPMGWPALPASMVPLNFERAAHVEPMVPGQFGGEARRYMKRTGRLFPRFGW